MRSAKRLGIVLALAVAGAALAGTLLTRCGHVGEATGATAVREGTLGVLPRESVALVVVEVKALRSREPVAAWLRDAASGAGRQEALDQVRTRFGAQIIDRLERLSLAVLPVEGVTMGWAILAEGAFDEAAAREAIAGQEILTLFEAEGRPDLSVTVLKGGSLVFGPRTVLAGVRGNAARRGSGLDANSALLDLLGTIRPATAQVWGAVDYKPLASLARRAAASEGMQVPSISKAPGADSLVALTFQGNLGDTLVFDLMGRADAPASAKTLADAARGLVALARMAAGQDSARAWAEALDGITIDQKGKDVALHGAIAEPAVAAIIKMMKSPPPPAPVQAVAPAAPGNKVAPRLAPGPAQGSALPPVSARKPEPAAQPEAGPPAEAPSPEAPEPAPPSPQPPPAPPDTSATPADPAPAPPEPDGESAAPDA